MIEVESTTYSFLLRTNREVVRKRSFENADKRPIFPISIVASMSTIPIKVCNEMIIH